MKKMIVFCLLILAIKLPAQVQMVDVSSYHTNVYSQIAIFTVPGYFTNVLGTITMYTNISVGDNLNTASIKANSNMVYVTNQLMLALQLPNQINTNLQAQISTNVVAINNVSNNLQNLTNLVTSLPGGFIQNSTVGTNKFTSGTMTWLNSLQEVQSDTGGFGGTTLKLGASDNGAAMYLHVDSSGTITATGSP